MRQFLGNDNNKILNRVEVQKWEREKKNGLMDLQGVMRKMGVGYDQDMLSGYAV